MSSKKSLSIIIPIFNTATYLPSCLDSILKNQFLDKIEVILVNDGSTDDSESICKQYISNNKGLFKYIKIKNSGLSEARNTGLKLASGSKIWFVDSDDMISPNSTKSILSEDDHDITMIQYSFLIDKKLIAANQDYVKNPIHRYIINTPIVPIRIFRKKFLDTINFKFKKNRFYEDSGSMYELVKYTDDIFYLDKNLYIYRKRANSITTDPNILKKSDDRFWATNQILNNVPDKYRDEKEYQAIKTIGLFYTFDLFNNPIKNKRRFLNETIEYLNTNIPKYYNNKYLKRNTKVMYAYRTYLICLHLRLFLLCKVISSLRTKII